MALSDTSAAVSIHKETLCPPMSHLSLHGVYVLLGRRYPSYSATYSDP